MKFENLKYIEIHRNTLKYVEVFGPGIKIFFGTWT